MSILRTAVEGVDRVQRRMDALAVAADAEVWAAIDQQVRIIGASADRRAIVARGTNVQDDTRRQRLGKRSPVQVRRFRRALSVLVIVGPFWTNARSRAMRNLYARHGLGPRLKRSHLWVDRARGGRNRAILAGGGSRSPEMRRQHDTRAGLSRVSMRHLLAWAEGDAGDRGDQHLASVVRPPGAVRRDLVLGPAIREHGPETVSRIHAAVTRATNRTRSS